MDSKEFDGTQIAKVIFSCVQSINERFGLNYIASILAGSKAKKIQKFGHDKIASYGTLDHYSVDQIKDFIKQLVNQGFLYKTKNEYPVIRLLDKANFIQLGTDKIILKEPDRSLAKKVRI